MIKRLNQLKEKAIEEIEKTLDGGTLEKLEKKYLGRKGSLRKVLEGFKDIKEEIDKKNIGALANEIKKELLELIESKKAPQDEKSQIAFDPTIEGKKIEIGHLHPITQFLRRALSIFISMGFEIYEGPEIETEEYNFDLLNIPKDHPARDVWDTFYLEGGLLLRTHTSPGQIRVMEEKRPPVRIVIPGKCYRHEATDAKHEVNFYQVEGLVIDEKVSLTDLIGTLDAFIKQIFGDEIKTRARPSFFPFVEPGMEVDMSCMLCGGKGCSTCQGEGWIEVLGAGMVHPRVLQNMKVDPKKYFGFAFGMGIDRLMMLYYGVNDIRLSYSGDLRFIRQF